MLIESNSFRVVHDQGNCTLVIATFCFASDAYNFIHRGPTPDEFFVEVSPDNGRNWRAIGSVGAVRGMSHKDLLGEPSRLRTAA